MSIRTYSELIQLSTFEERFRYLQLHGKVGFETFGFDRYLNQGFYQSSEWKRVRRQVILRDQACDLGIPDRQLDRRVMVHHMNPILEKDIYELSEFLLNPEYLITVSHETHNAIHYGDEGLLILAPVERRPNDMCPWL